MSVRIAVLMGGVVLAFYLGYAGSGNAWSDNLVVASFGSGVLLLLAIDVMSAVLLTRFGHLLIDVVKRGMAPGRDTALAYAAVTFAFGVPAIAMLAAGFWPFAFVGA
jgi:hypothetical protein